MLLYLFLLFLHINALNETQDTEKPEVILASSLGEVENIYPYLEVLESSFAIEDSLTVFTSSHKFKALSKHSIDNSSSVNWLRFQISNDQETPVGFILSVVYTDFVDFYAVKDGEIADHKISGNLVKISERSLPVGKRALIRVNLQANSTYSCYVKLESTTLLSEQFRPLALKSINLYNADGYHRRFEQPRMIQAMFYGALIIMLIYNVIIFFSLKGRSYLYYVLFIFFTIIYFLAVDGYVSEIFFDYLPGWELYIRFLSVPCLMICYLAFCRSYLMVKIYTPGFNKAILAIIGYFIIVTVFISSGFWYWGRNLIVLGGLVAFSVVLFAGVKSFVKGYTPANYFLAANSIFILVGIVFCYQRLNVVVEDPTTHYSIQMAALLNIVIFSLGLADRIKLFRKEIENKKLEAERLEKEKEIEKKKLIEEKNQELELKVVERTAEIIDQKEEIELQKEILEQNNVQLEKAQRVINEQNLKLKYINKHLEQKVRERTLELEISNHELQKAVKELDHFIYRTAHDIRGPLARLMGLCNVALLEVEDQTALQYLEKLDITANKLNYILNRLSTLHEINTIEPHFQQIDFKNILDDTVKQVKSMGKHKAVRYIFNLDEKITFFSDPHLMKAIFLNLIDNCLKNQDSVKKEPFIEITIFRQVQNEDDVIKINVVDNGKGIREEDKPFIFQMFSKAAGLHDSPGLGLYMVKTCVEKLKGVVYLKENENNFTEFEIIFPLNPLHKCIDPGGVAKMH